MALLKIKHFDDILQGQLDSFIDGYFKYKRNSVHVKNYLKQTLHPTIATDGVLRLSQSVINFLLQDQVAPCTQNVFRLYEDFFAKCAIPTHELSTKFIEMTESVSDLSVPNLTTLRNICLVTAVLVELFEKEDFRFTDESVRLMMASMSDVICRCEHAETVLYAAIVICKLAKFSPDGIKGELKEGMTRLAEHVDQANEVTYYNLPKVEPLRYQVSFLARCFLDHELDALKQSDGNSSLKLSLDGLSVSIGSLQPDSYPIRSTFAVTSGVFYYEVIFMTGGNVSVGWATKENDFGGYSNREKYAFYFNRDLCHFAYKSKYKRVDNLPRWTAGDVVGCLIDVPNRKFIFYLNGQQVDHQMKVYFSPQPYFASAIITKFQCCYFNFGQVPFKHSPSDIEFNSFHSAASGIVKHYRLLQPIGKKSPYWFKDELVDGQVSPLFVDDKQKQFDQWVKDAEKAVLDCQEEILVNEELTERIKSMLTENSGLCCLRLVQSVIEVMGFDLDEDKIDPVVNWVIKNSFQLNFDDYIKLPLSDTKLTEMMYMYSQMQLNTPENAIKRRNVCILLGYSDFSYASRSEFYINDIFKFIVNALEESESKWTLLFAIRFVQFMANHETNPDTHLQLIQHSTEELSKIASILDKCSPSEFYENNLHRLRYHLGMVAKWYLDNGHLVGDLNEDFAELIYSPDYLSVISRSVNLPTALSAFVVNSGVFYYEVIILTQGSMTIGWTSQPNRLSRNNVVGENEHSIGLGYDPTFDHITIWHNGPHAIDNLSQWKVGNVIGCLIDVSARLFRFYLNGQQVDMPENVFFSNQPYSPAVTLPRKQKCYFNFGQMPFKHVPDYVEQVNNFDAFTGGNVLQYQLVEPCFAG